MIRLVFLVTILIILQGCTVGWYTLRDSSGNVRIDRLAKKICPAEFELNVNSSRYTNTFGKKDSHPDHLLELEQKFRSATDKILNKHGCFDEAVTSRDNARKLNIEVIEQIYLSALPQEWLTGLSFGLIPSWGTRPERWRFKFSISGLKREYVVDDTRFHHLVAFPVFWISFSLMSVMPKYEQALEEFIITPYNSN
jgi:hypothetical protein